MRSRAPGWDEEQDAFRDELFLLLPSLPVHVPRTTDTTSLGHPRGDQIYRCHPHSKVRHHSQSTRPSPPPSSLLSANTRPDQRCSYHDLPEQHRRVGMVPRARVLARWYPTPPPLLLPHRRAQLHLHPLPPQLPLRPPRRFPPPHLSRSLLDPSLPPSLFLPISPPYYPTHDFWNDGE